MRYALVDMVMLMVLNHLVLRRGRPDSSVSVSRKLLVSAGSCSCSLRGVADTGNDRPRKIGPQHG